MADVTNEWNTFRYQRKNCPVPAGVHPEEDTPIVLAARYAGQGSNLRPIGFRVISCPNYVWRFVFDGLEIQPPSIIRSLVKLGHSFRVEREEDHTP